MLSIQPLFSAAFGFEGGAEGLALAGSLLVIHLDVLSGAFTAHGIEMTVVYGAVNAAQTMVIFHGCYLLFLAGILWARKAGFIQLYSLSFLIRMRMASTPALMAAEVSSVMVISRPAASLS